MNPLPNVFASLYRPWPGRQNPLAAAHEARMEQLLADCGIFREDPARLRRFRHVVALDSLVYPDADADRLTASGGINHYLFFLDDLYDDDPSVGQNPQAARVIMERYLHALSTGCLGPTPDALERYSCNLHHQLVRLASPEWVALFMQEVRSYLFKGSILSVEAWSSNHLPDIDTYIEERTIDAGLWVATQLVELATNIIPPADPLLYEARTLTARHVAIANDLFSYQKEVMEQGCPWNMVHVIMVKESCTFPEAVAQVQEMLNGWAARFEEIYSLKPEASAYLDGLWAWVTGNIDTSLSSKRYCRVDSPFAELRPAAWSPDIDQELRLVA